MAVATANSHVLQIMAGSSLNVRIHWIEVRRAVAPAGVTAMEVSIVRLTTAGTGGTALTPAKASNADSASGATGMTLPTAKGTEGAFVQIDAITYGTAAISMGLLEVFRFDHTSWEEPLIIPAGTSNGIAIKNTTGLATATVAIKCGFTETSYV